MKKKNSNGWGFRLINGIILAVISLMTLYPFFIRYLCILQRSGKADGKLQPFAEAPGIFPECI